MSEYPEASMRYAGTFFFIAAILCLAAAGYDYFFTQPAIPLPPFEIAQTEFAVGNAPTGTQLLRTKITNPSKEPRRVLGIVGQCIGNCCFMPLEGGPIIILPGSSFDLACELDVNRPGPIDAAIKIYLEENGIRTVTLRVTGTAVEAPHAPK